MKYRMYFFVPYNISEIQKGIQAGHAALEYAERFYHTATYRNFITADKTWVILNGGTTRGQFQCEDGEGLGSMNEISISLVANYIPHANFCESDLNYALSAICFLADERVFDFKKYPDYDFDKEWRTSYIERVGGEKNSFLRELIRDKRLA